MPTPGLPPALAKGDLKEWSQIEQYERSISLNPLQQQTALSLSFRLTRAEVALTTKNAVSAPQIGSPDKKITGAKVHMRRGKGSENSLTKFGKDQYGEKIPDGRPQAKVGQWSDEKQASKEAQPTIPSCALRSTGEAEGKADAGKLGQALPSWVDEMYAHSSNGMSLSADQQLQAKFQGTAAESGANSVSKGERMAIGPSLFEQTHQVQDPQKLSELQALLRALETLVQKLDTEMCQLKKADLKLSSGMAKLYTMMADESLDHDKDSLTKISDNLPAKSEPTRMTSSKAAKAQRTTVEEIPKTTRKENMKKIIMSKQYEYARRTTAIARNDPDEEETAKNTRRNKMRYLIIGKQADYEASMADLAYAFSDILSPERQSAAEESMKSKLLIDRNNFNLYDDDIDISDARDEAEREEAERDEWVELY